MISDFEPLNSVGQIMDGQRSRHFFFGVRKVLRLSAISFGIHKLVRAIFNRYSTIYDSILVA